MKRSASVLLAVVLVLSACGGGSGKTAARSTTTSAKPKPKPSTTTEPVPTTIPLREDHVAITADCPGIGPVPAAGQVTWVKGGQLMAAAPDGSGHRCLVETSGAPNLAWGGKGDRVLAGQRTIVLANGPQQLGASTEQIEAWSRPTGRAVIVKTQDGELRKLSTDAEPVVDLYSATTTEARYHPAGLSIVMVVPEGDRPGLLMTSNLGENARWLVENENAKSIHDLAFTSTGALVFVADHDDGQHVHLLPLDSEAPDLVDLFEPPVGDTLGAVATSPFAEDWAFGADCAGHAALHRDFDGEPTDFPDEVTDAEPIGWLPSGDLVVLTHPDGCGQPGDLYVVDGDTSTPRAHLIDRGVDGAAVRAVLPPPPPAPAEIEAAPS